MLYKLPRWRVLRLALWLVVGSLLFGVWTSKSVLAVGHTQTDDNTGRISGFVMDIKGVPLAGIEIRAYVYDPRPEYVESWAYPWWYAGDGVIVTDGAGTYQFSNLPPGIYTLRYSDPTDTYAFEYYTDATMLKDAIRIEVRAAQTTNLQNVVLVPGGTISS